MTDITRKELNKILYLVTSETYLKAIIDATPTGETGNVSSAWDLKITDDEIIIYNDEFGDIVKYLESGTGLYGPKGKKYEILPKNGKALAFMFPNATTPANGKGGEHVFKGVMHPGIKARHFIEKVMEDKSVENEWNKMLYKELEKLVNSKLK